MKYFVIVFTLVVCSLEASAQSYRAVSLFSLDAIVTGRFLPFKIYDEQNQVMNIKKVQVLGACHGLKDFSKATVVHVYCTEPGDVEFIATLENNQAVSVGPFPIKKVSLIETDVILPGDGDSLGKKLWNNNCVECHASSPVPKGQSRNSVLSALQTSPMVQRNLYNLFNGDNEKLDAIVKYINEGK